MKLFLSLIFVVGFSYTNAFAEEVIVPVPNNLVASAKLTVAGQQGAEQSSTFNILKIELDSLNHPVLDKSVDLDKGTLNVPMTLRPGHYIVRYSHTTYPDIITLRENDNVGITLSKLKVPKVDGNYKFKVFLEFRQPSKESDKLSTVYWVGLRNKNFCGADAKGLASEYCQAYKGSYENFLKFNREKFVTPTGNRLALYPDGTTVESEIEVTDPRDGDFVSVFPGEYMIKFTDSFGNTETVRSIVVK